QARLGKAVPEAPLPVTASRACRVVSQAELGKQRTAMNTKLRTFTVKKHFTMKVMTNKKVIQ
ncbi:MAG: hypothetical protein CVV06_17460, partial [Gammaproteobacteria bacterium HGW-Gammaproteobacteria-10]